MNVALRPEPDALNLISLCTGGGGLDRAVELAIPTARPVVCVEREAFAVASLVAQIEAGLMAPAAIHGDVRTFPGRRFRGVVDGLIGGIPCQGHSLAGRRQGSLDERDLWSPARRIIAQARPWFVLIENVGGMLTAGADEIPGAFRVRRDLRKLGYESTLVIVRADQMGLPHERLRVFILGVARWMAHPDDRGEIDGRRPESSGTIGGRPRDAAGGSGSRLAYAKGAGLEGRRRGRDSARSFGEERMRAPRGGRGAMADADLAELRREPPAGEQPLLQQDDGAGGGHQMEHAPGDGRREGWPKPVLRRGRCATSSDGGELVNALSGGRPGRPEGALGRSVGRAAEQQLGAVCDEQCLADGDGAELPAQQRDAGEVRGLSEGQGGPEHGPALSGGGRPFLRPPGPGDYDAWRAVAERAPGLLPAVSRYDRLRLEMGAQGLVADGDPSSGAWLDAQTGARVRSPVLQAAIERALRGVADVMAPRIDELRMLGNGVADAQGALAVRIGAHDLAARGSAGAALLVRMMEAA